MAAFDKNSIPGYADAVARERKAREEAYLNLPHDVCGIQLKQITPYLYGLLSLERNPFVTGGTINEAAIAQFLWTLHIDFAVDSKKRDAFLKSLEDADWIGLQIGIEELLDLTFLDAPYGGGLNQSPLFCNMAWMEYRLAAEPFRWARDTVLHSPLRVIYQLMRCDAWNHGDKTLVNRWSDQVVDDWMHEKMKQEKEAQNAG